MSFRVVAFAILLVVPLALSAQSFSIEPCANHENTGSDRVCELRRTTLALVDGRIALDGQNGSIEITGEARHDVSLEAKVTTKADTLSDAQAMLAQIKIETHGTIHATGPRYDSGRNWSVSYRLRVPRELAANLRTENGSLALTNLKGNIEGTAANGSINLTNLAGDIHLQTTNGSISADLGGQGWDGKGLSARTTNGAISVTLSPGYSAHLIASSTNGGIHLRRPDGEGAHGRNIDTQLGRGGATLMFQTVNGGVSIR